MKNEIPEADKNLLRNYINRNPNCIQLPFLFSRCEKVEPDKLLRVSETHFTNQFVVPDFYKPLILIKADEHS